LSSIVIGVVITLASGLFRTPFERVGVDVVRSGLPLVWSMRVIPRPTSVIWSNFLVDIGFWVLIGFVAVSVEGRLKRMAIHSKSASEIER